jgi:predicted  nucleic acid-binding Zn-ribbon protein
MILTLMTASRDEIEALRAEVRRLRSVVQALTDEKKDLEERLAFLAQELERMRARVTGQIRTS